MEIIKNSCLYIVFGLITTTFCCWLDSNFLSNFLHNQIITLLITLVAITSAIRALILGKITDLSKDNRDLDIQETFKELKVSLYEQITMIFLSILLLVIYNSNRFKISSDVYYQFIIDSLLTTILFYNIYILCDTGKAIIDIYISIDKKNKSDN